jgi:hypothetical protein
VYLLSFTVLCDDACATALMANEMMGARTCTFCWQGFWESATMGRGTFALKKWAEAQD